MNTMIATFDNSAHRQIANAMRALISRPTTMNTIAVNKVILPMEILVFQKIHNP